MRVLIDECPNWRICRGLEGHECTSVQRMGWGGLTNGDLLRKAELEFDAFISGDRNLSFQQQPLNFEIAIVVLHGGSTQLDDTMSLMPKVVSLLPQLKSGEVVHVYP